MTDKNWTLEAKDDGGYIIRDSYGGLVAAFTDEASFHAEYLTNAVELRDRRARMRPQRIEAPDAT